MRRRERGPRDGERRVPRDRASASLFEIRRAVALCYAQTRHRNWQFRGAGRPRDTIPKPEFGISARYESVDNARNSLVMRLVRSREETRVRGIALEATLFLNHSLSFCQIARRYPARRSRFVLMNQLARVANESPPPPSFSRERES